jgi:hypothetical protein
VVTPADVQVPGGCWSLERAIVFTHAPGHHRRTAGGDFADLWSVAFRAPGDRVRWLGLGWLLGCGGFVCDAYYRACWLSPGSAARARSLVLASDSVARAVLLDGLSVDVETVIPTGASDVPVRQWGISCRRRQSRRGGGLLVGWVGATLEGEIVPSPRGAWRGLSVKDAGSIVRWFPGPAGCVLSAERLPF